MNVEQLSIDDPWVTEFLEQYLEPQDIRHDYKMSDAMAFVREQVSWGNCLLVGCKQSRVVFRCMAANPKVLEPHIMGNGLRVRSVTKAAIPLAWSLGYEKIVVWTQHKALAAAMLNIGFTQDATLPRYHLHNDNLFDLHILSFTKGDSHEHLPPKTLLTW
jgi:hypothetical protein